MGPSGPIGALGAFFRGQARGSADDLPRWLTRRFGHGALTRPYQTLDGAEQEGLLIATGQLG
eukprot:11049760-Lingulodinium_polyedra.AAC.1